ncbi:hypothetical protein A3C67_02185 [Candidatus Nomurabacteria bacterium RIFCSPHIGHO2_02_FULL_42_19]|uniref:DUF559 domain-containing protein n=1 Tax=Candidatus Nomurabacteria bacterium RIFCSPHIGHO2_02_FULL_42_19 TaxID=1801756 RepID=A0A1F6W3F8_9BACT|nr:MAG: hypothetical protein A3C67_02185 [Candidatus Nomurabacteria bacterium RIFCSPHIGHO2_02_FULL_42_19]
MQKYNIPYIPYDKKLVSRARELRKEEIETERKFWNEILKDEKLNKYKFTRQKPLDHFINPSLIKEGEIQISIKRDSHLYFYSLCVNINLDLGTY